MLPLPSPKKYFSKWALLNGKQGVPDPTSCREREALGSEAKVIDVQGERPSNQDLVFILNSVLLPHNTVSYKACTFKLNLVSWHCPDIPHLCALVHGPLPGPRPQTSSSFLSLPPSAHEHSTSSKETFLLFPPSSDNSLFPESL